MLESQNPTKEDRKINVDAISFLDYIRCYFHNSDILSFPSVGIAFPSVFMFIVRSIDSDILDT